MTTTATDRIEKTTVLGAPRARVWRALTNADEFGAWFRARLTGTFAEGAVVRGPITYPGYEHLTLEIQVERMQPERYFSFRWHPNAVDPKGDYSSEPTTLVEFTLEEVTDGTRLTIVESGFDKLPPDGATRRGARTTAAGPSRSRISPAMSKARNAAAARLHETAPVFAALGDPTRLRIVARLCAGGPQSITRLSEDADVTRQAVTKHLVALAGAGLARPRREGREQIWALDTRRLALARRTLEDISGQWDSAIVRLRAFVESTP